MEGSQVGADCAPNTPIANGAIPDNSGNPHKRRGRIIAIVVVVVLVLAAVIGGGTWFIWNQHRHDAAYAQCLQTLSPVSSAVEEAGKSVQAATDRTDDEAYSAADKELAATLDDLLASPPAQDTSNLVQCTASMSYEQLVSATESNTMISNEWTDYAKQVDKTLSEVNYSIATHEYPFPELFNMVVNNLTTYPLAGEYCRADGGCVTISEDNTIEVTTQVGDDPLPTDDPDIDTNTYEIGPAYQSIMATPSEPTWINLCASNVDSAGCTGAADSPLPADMVYTPFTYVPVGVDISGSFNKLDTANPPDNTKAYLVFSARRYTAEELSGNAKTQPASDSNVYYYVPPTK